MRILFDDLADLFQELNKHQTQAEIAHRFGRQRKFIQMMQAGCGFRCDSAFLAGLKSYGYDLKLVKKGEENPEKHIFERWKKQVELTEIIQNNTRRDKK